jgi:hypothetical protein
MNDISPIEIQIPSAGQALATGNLNLLGGSRAAILNSRQGKFPSGDASWIQRTLEVVGELVCSNKVIVSSTGMFTWELVTWKTGACGGKLILVLEDAKPKDVPVVADSIVRDFGLDMRNTLFLFPGNSAEIQGLSSGLPRLDCFIATLADTLCPVAIRSRGNLAAILDTFRATPTKVDERFAVFYGGTSRKSARSKVGMELCVSENLRWDFLTHWTRAATGPWPDETRAEFYASFEQGMSSYPRNAFHTLRRILQERRIRASKQLVRGDEAVVSLTACPPWELAKLVKWRPSLFRWTFEPYGMALRRMKLESLGARSVVYGNDDDYRSLKEQDKPFFQSCGRGKNDWRVENEWRHLGDLNLSHFGPHDATVFVLTEEEATILQKDSPFPVVHWNDIPKRLGTESF